MMLAPTEIQRRFSVAVNMTAGELAAWLKTPESRKVGFRRRGDRQSVGHRSGYRILGLLRNGPTTEADYRHMRKVVSYVARHTAQRPAGDVSRTPWRYSLMNWGHDPLIGGGR